MPHAREFGSKSNWNPLSKLFPGLDSIKMIVFPEEYKMLKIVVPGRMEQGKTLSKRRRSTLLRGSVWDCFLSKVKFFREIVKWPHVCNIFYLQLCHNLKIKGVVGRSTFSLCFTFFEVKAVKQNYAMYSILTSKCSEK